MKHALTFILLALLCGAVFATDRNPSPGPSVANSIAGASSQGGAGGNVSGDAWAVALPGHGSPSYAGNYSICVRGSGFGWNFMWSWSPDMECVKMIADLERLNRTPVPVAPVALLTEPKCEVPANAKSVTAAKKAGACKG